MEAGTCSCPAGNVTHTLRTWHPDQPVGSDLPWPGVSNSTRRSVAYAPCGPSAWRRGTGPVTVALIIPKRRSCNKPGTSSGVRALLNTVGCARRPSSPGAAGAAGATGGPPISLLRPSQDPIPTTHGGDGGQPDPGGYQDGDDISGSRLLSRYTGPASPRVAHRYYPIHIGRSQLGHS